MRRLELTSVPTHETCSDVPEVCELLDGREELYLDHDMYKNLVPLW